jgi:hypothetical protein
MEAPELNTVAAMVAGEIVANLKPYPHDCGGLPSVVRHCTLVVTSCR